MERYHTALLILIRKMISIVGAGLPNVNFSIFEDFMANYPIAFLSPKHYPPTNDDEAIGCGEHTDFGALTLLLQDGTPGLEIKYNNEWVPVEPVRDAYGPYLTSQLVYSCADLKIANSRKYRRHDAQVDQGKVQKYRSSRSSPERGYTQI